MQMKVLIKDGVSSAEPSSKLASQNEPPVWSAGENWLCRLTICLSNAVRQSSVGIRCVLVEGLLCEGERTLITCKLFA
jgi:hypothetical protein